MGQTIIEKIFSGHAGQTLKALDCASCDIDLYYSQDQTSPFVFDQLTKSACQKIKSPKKYAMVIDHNAPSARVSDSQIHSQMREFSRNNDIALYDIGCGISSQVLIEQGLISPGALVAGADYRAGTIGAIGAIGLSVSPQELTQILITGKNQIQVPQTIKIVLTKKLIKGVYVKDLILHLIKTFGVNSFNSKAIEFCGDTIDHMSMDSRFSLVNMAAELGAKYAIIAVDKTTKAYLKSIKAKTPKIINSDKDCSYAKIIEINVAKIKPLIATAHAIDNIDLVKNLEGTVIHQAFLGSCANGRLEDLEVAAKILKGKKIHPQVKLFIAPASAKILGLALKKGVIRVLSHAGAIILPPGCGPCAGTHQGVPADKEITVSSANNNSQGRMGNPNSFIYIASAATVAVCALRGIITDPRKFLKSANKKG